MSENFIKKLRIQLGLSRKIFAKILGVSQASITHYEKGIRSPDIKVAYKMTTLAKIHNRIYVLEDIYPIQKYLPNFSAWKKHILKNYSTIPTEP